MHRIIQVPKLGLWAGQPVKMLTRLSTNAPAIRNLAPIVAGVAFGVGASSLFRYVFRERQSPRSVWSGYDLNPESQHLKAEQVNTSFKRKGPAEKGSAIYVPRIALTGGPCAGKSSSMQNITDTLLKLGYDVYFVPEVPTVLMNGGCKYPGIDGGKLLVEFEIALMSLQLQMERSFTQIAASTARPSVLIMDRGLLDIKARCRLTSLPD
jgi:hypothetical protein